MYSGFVTSKRTTQRFGVHQRFDRAAYGALVPHIDASQFPAARQIIHFEGMNGPDGLKVKSPGSYEPSHLYNPVTDTGPIPEHISHHYRTMVQSLRTSDHVRAAFEAAWLAHYVTDGLTPAHHYPLNEELDKYMMRPKDTGKNFLQHYIAIGGSPLDIVRTSWAIWGAKGLLSTHFNFEMGVATALLTSKVSVELDMQQFVKAQTIGLIPYFKTQSLASANMMLYEDFYKTGWTNSLARKVKFKLAPLTVETIAVIWLMAYHEALAVKPKASVKAAVSL